MSFGRMTTLYRMSPARNLSSGMRMMRTLSGAASSSNPANDPSGLTPAGGGTTGAAAGAGTGAGGTGAMSDGGTGAGTGGGTSAVGAGAGTGAGGVVGSTGG